MGPIWQGGGHGEWELLVSAYRSSLELALANRCERVVFPLISSGVYGCPKDQAFKVAVDTIGGFNAMIEQQKKGHGEVFVSTVLFDDQTEVLHDRVKLGEVQPITDKEYYVWGCTALLDAVGGAIHHIGNIHKYARSGDVPEHTLFVITTDGMENASRCYPVQRVKEMIRHQKEKYGW